MSREEKRLDKIRDDKSRQETRQDESRRDKKRQETRRNETRQNTRNQETRRDKTRHFRNRIFRPSERRRITLRKQYTLDPRLSWTLKNNTFRRPKCFRGWQWSQLPCSGGFQTRYHYQPLLDIVATWKCDPSSFMRPSDQGYFSSLTYYLLLWRPEILHSMVIDFIVTRLLNEFWTIVKRLLNECWSIIKRLLNDGCTIVKRLLNYCWTNVTQLLNDCWKIVERLLHDCWTLVKRLLNDN